MAKIKIDLPEIFYFSVTIPVRITDLNYGGHVGNDSILSMIHEARARFLAADNYSELNFGGVGLIMNDVAIIFKNELFYGDNLRIWVTVSELSKASFTLFYKLEKEADGKIIPVAQAQTGMVCFDYSRKKITAIPGEVAVKWNSRYSSFLPPAE